MKKSIEVKSITTWVNEIRDGKVVLPMIQRGSVWPPHKVLDLWDTLLRGMPLGAMMSTPISGGAKVFSLINRETIIAPDGAISLLDGQQRSLGILSGWPEIEDMLQRPVVVWIDLADEPQGEYRHFRLLATTRAQPYGYERVPSGGQPLSKLETSARRLANWTYNREGNDFKAWDLWKRNDFMPWKAKFAVRMSDLMSNKNRLQEYVVEIISEKTNGFEEVLRNLDEDEKIIRSHFESKIEFLKCLKDDNIKWKKIKSRIDDLTKAFDMLNESEFPIIPIGDSHFDENDDSQGDPPLAVLFKRVGSGGQVLSNEDYIFSVIKHYSPETHTLIESLFKINKNELNRITALYKQTDLVMAAVRLTLLKIRNEPINRSGEIKHSDRAKMDKIFFANLIRKEATFIDNFKELIKEDGEFSNTIKKTLNAIAYSDQFTKGLPIHALPSLINHSLFDALLAWEFLTKSKDLSASRLSMVRFLLWGNLCIVGDKAKASELCIKKLEEGKFEIFPDIQLMRILIEEGIAHPFPSPDDLKNMPGLVSSNGKRGEKKILRGWSRFHFPDLTETKKYIPEIYKRWWNFRNSYHHPMLLWLQREYVHRQFEDMPVMAGMEDETPYDFDHLLPQSHWYGWTGIGEGSRLIDFHANDADRTGHYTIGNALGNVRVWSAQENRSDGDSPPSTKFKLDDENYSKIILDNSCVDQAGIEIWKCASGAQGRNEKNYWDANRAFDFQQAVELRTFELYEVFYVELDANNTHSVSETISEDSASNKK